MRMSDNLDDFNKKLKEDQEIEKAIELNERRKILAEKDLTLKEHRTELDLSILIKNSAELEQAKTVSFDKLTPEEVAHLVKENDEYMEAAKHAMNFINKEFRGKVPYFRKNLILVLADTGGGKSTAVANIVYETMTQVNPATGKVGKVLVITNEEAAEDFYNRITCFIKGWNYTKHNEFNDEQRKTFSEFIPKLSRDGRLTVIGDTYQGIPGWTRTIEGIETIFNNLIRDGVRYDAVIIDYYQNVASSKNDPRLDINKCQEKLADSLDKFKNSYPAPIIIMAQINKRKDEEDTTPFNVRIKGRKILCDKATFICELVPDHKRLKSTWVIHKSRFTGSVGEYIETGFDRGKFVPYDERFQLSISAIVNKNIERELGKKLPNGISEKEGKDE